MGFNQRKTPDRTVCVAVDLSAAFDTVCHNKLLSKINPLPKELAGGMLETCSQFQLLWQVLPGGDHIATLLTMAVWRNVQIYG